LSELEDEEKPAPPPQPSPSGRTRTPSNRFRPSSTGIGRLAQNNTRRPMAVAPAPVVDGGPQKARTQTSDRRGGTEADYEVATDVADWKNREPIAVDDDQLVDWSSSEETVTTGEDYDRKR
jgi:hypothetical protein